MFSKKAETIESLKKRISDLQEELYLLDDDVISSILPDLYECGYDVEQLEGYYLKKSRIKWKSNYFTEIDEIKEFISSLKGDEIFDEADFQYTYYVEEKLSKDELEQLKIVIDKQKEFKNLQKAFQAKSAKQRIKESEKESFLIAKETYMRLRGKYE